MGSNLVLGSGCLECMYVCSIVYSFIIIINLRNEVQMTSINVIVMKINGEVDKKTQTLFLLNFNNYLDSLPLASFQLEAPFARPRTPSTKTFQSSYSLI